MFKGLRQKRVRLNCKKTTAFCVDTKKNSLTLHRCCYMLFV